MRRLASHGLLVLLALAAASAPGRAQVTLEVYGGAGVTSVDDEEWAGGTVTSSEMTWSALHVQVMGLRAGPAVLGLEVGYEYLLWYEVPYGTDYLDYDVDATNVMGVARIPFTEFIFGELHGGIYAFDGFTDPALGAAIGGRIPLSSRWSIPVRVRASMILDSSANVIPIGFQAGVSYGFQR